MYEQDSKDGHCYIWPETSGKRGANEIATCLAMYLESLPEHVTHVSSFSDTCSGQNRNIHVTASLLHAVRKIPNLEIIDLKFMESGHSSMEVDSMHSAIEKARKYQKVYNPHEWAMICQSARRNKPYHINELRNEEFLDYHKLSQAMVINRSKTTTGETANWLKIKWFRFRKENQRPSCIRNVLHDEFKEIDITRKPTGRAARRKSAAMNGEPTLQRAYEGPLPISRAKKADLMCLVRSGAIPQEYEAYYSSLTSTEDVRDALEEPDMEDTDTELD